MNVTGSLFAISVLAIAAASVSDNNNCKPNTCMLIRITCDQELTAGCNEERISPRGGGYCGCCPVCYSTGGEVCNEKRICQPGLVCIQARCQRHTRG